MGAESPLVDGTAQWFCTIVKTCVLPCKSAALAADTLEVLVCAPKDDKGSTVLLRFLTLLVRSGMARGAVFDAWYDVLLQHMKQPTTAPDAMRLLHAITRKRRVRAYRAQKLKRWYEASRDANEKQQTGALWLLLQLYGRYDQRNCGRYCPAQKVAMSVLRLFQCEFRLEGSPGPALVVADLSCRAVPDTKWEVEFRQRQQELVPIQPHRKTRGVDTISGENNAVSP